MSVTATMRRSSLLLSVALMLISAHVRLAAPMPCITAMDCAMNGECRKEPSATSQRINPQTPGLCDCFPGWKGDTCEVLDLLAVDMERKGLQLPNHDSSTWGGSVVYRDGQYHMFASEIINGCGLYSWTTNSQIIRAVSEHPLGPYRKVQLVLPTFAHLANILEAPTGELVLLATMHPHPHPKDCRNGTTLLNGDIPVAPPKDTYMQWSHHPEGPWSSPQLVLNSTIWNSDYWKGHIAHCDSNLNGMIRKDGSFLGLWRKCETDQLRTVPHTLHATDWWNASTYQPNTEPLFPLGGAGAEDPSNIWTTTTESEPDQVAYHAIFHDEQATRCMEGQCSANGRHAFSLDGYSWRYASVDCYDRNVMFVSPHAANATRTLSVDTRARPHVILDPKTQQPMALSTGLKETDASGYVWTLVQGMRFPEQDYQSSS